MHLSPPVPMKQVSYSCGAAVLTAQQAGEPTEVGRLNDCWCSHSTSSQQSVWLLLFSPKPLCSHSHLPAWSQEGTGCFWGGKTCSIASSKQKGLDFAVERMA